MRGRQDRQVEWKTLKEIEKQGSRCFSWSGFHSVYFPHGCCFSSQIKMTLILNHRADGHHSSLQSRLLSEAKSLSFLWPGVLRASCRKLPTVWRSRDQEKDSHQNGGMAQGETRPSWDISSLWWPAVAASWKDGLETRGDSLIRLDLKSIIIFNLLCIMLDESRRARIQKFHQQVWPSPSVKSRKAWNILSKVEAFWWVIITSRCQLWRKRGRGWHTWLMLLRPLAVRRRGSASATPSTQRAAEQTNVHPAPAEPERAR